MAGAGAPSQERLSHLALGTRERQSLQGGGSSRHLPSAKDLGYTKKRGRRISAKICCYGRAGILVSSRILLCVKGRGRSWAIPEDPLLHRCPFAVQGMSPAGDRSPASANRCKDLDVWRK